jgi:signal transduction histidine kinase
MQQARDVAPPAGPIMDGAIGELFHATPDAVIVLHDGRVLVCNGPAEVFFGAGSAELAEVVDLPALLALPVSGMHRVDLRPVHGVADVLHRVVGDLDALIVRDVTGTVRHAEGLRRIARVSRELVSSPPSVAAVLQSLVTEAKALAAADYSALLLLREGSGTETSHFVYDAPRQRFPTRMPRVVGLLAVPVASKGAARLDDIRGHPAGVGLPGVHPPIGSLLAVPVLSGDEVLGELAVANAPGGRAFDEVDEQLLEDLAAHVAVAVRWAQQAERVREEELLRQEVVDTARHDIRTPLGAGKGYALLLARKLDKMSPEQRAIALDGLTGAFDRIESFTERLLVDERDALVGVEPVWGEVEVVPLLDALRRDAAAATGREAAVKVVHEPEAPQRLRGDPEMVREVLDNLVGNALKHTPEGREVVVSCRGDGAHVRFDVRDEGPGIAEAEQAALFERWSRTDSSRARQVPGFGLGLSIVKRLVTAHGGTLGVSSRAGEGATFWVTFPSEAP